MAAIATPVLKRKMRQVFGGARMEGNRWIFLLRVFGGLSKPKSLGY
jgi:hypothetical protein